MQEYLKFAIMMAMDRIATITDYEHYVTSLNDLLTIVYTMHGLEMLDDEHMQIALNYINDNTKTW